MGWLADRYGRRLILALGGACWSLATGLFAYQQSFGGLFAATIGIAIGEAGLAPIVFALIPDLFSERQRNSANFIFYGGVLLGGGPGMGLGVRELQGLAAAPHRFTASAAGLNSAALRVGNTEVRAEGICGGPMHK